MTRRHTGASAWHRALDAATAAQAEDEARAAAVEQRQREAGLIPTPSDSPDPWTRVVSDGEARAKAIAAEEAETARAYYERARRDAGMANG